MPDELYLTVEGLHELQAEDIEELRHKRQQSYSAAPLCDLLDILYLERRIGRRNAKINPLENILHDLPF